jgi:hypothetical protein
MRKGPMPVYLFKKTAEEKVLQLNGGSRFFRFG